MALCQTGLMSKIFRELNLRALCQLVLVRVNSKNEDLENKNFLDLFWCFKSISFETNSDT